MKSLLPSALLAFTVGLIGAMLHAGQMPAVPPAPPPPAPGVQLQVVLTDGSKIHGSPVEFSALPLKLEFTRIEVPLHLIAQGSFTAQRAAFAIRFNRNNDMLTGTLELERIRIQSAYGLAVIPIDRIATIIVTPAAPKP